MWHIFNILEDGKQMDKSGNWWAGQKRLEEEGGQSVTAWVPAWECRKSKPQRHEGIFEDQDKRNQSNWLHITIRSNYTHGSLLDSLPPQNYPFPIWQKAKVFFCGKVVGDTEFHHICQCWEKWWGKLQRVWGSTKHKKFKWKNGS